ncbi:hypothetical protein CYMTET_22351 [Cymbomonas tetramitiformis]|uniref:ShKT domain-containing protein n=1 Tax=Cymbomonas tetramitiformis TaxID=36881 RepID=A0AAE0L203_9CHLO|nr:hypothetical protein CYMTET_22351 [Cymbomonas tetramitiformis]
MYVRCIFAVVALSHWVTNTVWSFPHSLCYLNATLCGRVYGEATADPGTRCCGSMLSEDDMQYFVSGAEKHENLYFGAEETRTRDILSQEWGARSLQSKGAFSASTLHGHVLTFHGGLDKLTLELPPPATIGHTFTAVGNYSYMLGFWALENLHFYRDAGTDSLLHQLLMLHSIQDQFWCVSEDMLKDMQADRAKGYVDPGDGPALMRLDHATHTWTRVDTAVPSQRWFHSAVPYDNAIFFFGGFCNSDDSIDVYETHTNSWRTLETSGSSPSKYLTGLQHVLLGFTAVGVKNLMYVLGGAVLLRESSTAECNDACALSRNGVCEAHAGAEFEDRIGDCDPAVEECCPAFTDCTDCGAPVNVGCDWTLSEGMMAEAEPLILMKSAAPEDLCVNASVANCRRMCELEPTCAGFDLRDVPGYGLSCAHFTPPAGGTGSVTLVNASNATLEAHTCLRSASADGTSDAGPADCADTPGHVDAGDMTCNMWRGRNCSQATDIGYTPDMVAELELNCARSCGLCADQSEATWKGSKVHVLDLDTGEWSQGAPFLVNGDEAYTLGFPMSDYMESMHKLELGGGVLINEEENQRYGLDAAFSGDIHSLDLLDDEWNAASGGTSSVEHAPSEVLVAGTASSVGSHVYIIGGARNVLQYRTLHNTDPVNDTYILSLETRDWMDNAAVAPATAEDTFTARQLHSAAVVGSVVYVHGGRASGNVDYDLADALDDTFALDTATLTWRKVAAGGPRSGCQAAMVASDSMLYWFGGTDSAGYGTGALSVYCLDTARLEDGWTNIDGSIYGQASLGAGFEGHTLCGYTASLYMNGGIFAVMGVSIPPEQNVEVYHPEFIYRLDTTYQAEGTWLWTEQILVGRTGSSSAQFEGRQGHTMVSSGGVIFVFGGRQGNHAMTDAYVLLPGLTENAREVLVDQLESWDEVLPRTQVRAAIPRADGSLV